MADQWSKDKILTEYLNVVPYGAVTYGCEAAALRYFSRHCAQLTIEPGGAAGRAAAEPDHLQPDLEPQARPGRAATRCWRRCSSAGHITQAQYDTAVPHRSSARTPGRYLDRTGGDQGYFVSWVRQTLEEKLGRNTVKKGGLAIHTTLDPQLQDAAHTIAHAT